jgi:hypothetical protein
MTDIVCNIQKLPRSIQHHILSYTYNVQPQIVLDDIKSYFSTKCRIHSFYYHTLNLSIYLEQQEELNWLDWLEMDIILYTKTYMCSSFFGYTNPFYEIVYRHFNYHNRPIEEIDINRIVNTLRDKSPATLINVMWGLYTHNERIQFIKIMYDIDYARL